MPNVGWFDVVLLVIVAALIGAGMIVAYWQGREVGREDMELDRDFARRLRDL